MLPVRVTTHFDFQFSHLDCTNVEHCRWLAHYIVTLHCSSISLQGTREARVPYNSSLWRCHHWHVIQSLVGIWGYVGCVCRLSGILTHCLPRFGLSVTCQASSVMKMKASCAAMRVCTFSVVPVFTFLHVCECQWERQSSLWAVHPSHLCMRAI